MNIATNVLELSLFLICLVAAAIPLGFFMSKALENDGALKSPWLSKIDMYAMNLFGLKTAKDCTWKEYLFQVLLFNFLGFLVLFGLQLLQFHLPLNPQGLPGVEILLAMNTAVSFVTNTNWQAYSGETTMSYLVQTAGLTVQNFLSAATGIAILLAVIRGIRTKQTDRIGNFAADVVRIVIYILLPLSILVAVLLTSQGVVQTYSSSISVVTLDGGTQTIPLGPAASQVAIKQLGSNGGGFYGTNSIFPFENPTYFSNLIQVFSILLLPVACVFMFGFMLRSNKHARIIFAVMLTIFITGTIVSWISETSHYQLYPAQQLMEGKEMRIGVFHSMLWSVATTATSNGSVNAAMSSLSPLAGGVALLNMQLGEVVFGGVGSGMYGMILFILLTVFIAGLMVGRTPEYLGKKIETKEIKWTMVAILIPNLLILLMSSLAVYMDAGIKGVSHTGPHAVTEILYAFSSAAGNNGSAFAGLNAGSTFYLITTSISMLLGRFGVIIPMVIIAGSLAKKNSTPVSAGTLETHTPLFGFLLLGIIIAVGALTFFPALAIGPLLEHLLLNLQITF